MIFLLISLLLLAGCQAGGKEGQRQVSEPSPPVQALVIRQGDQSRRYTPGDRGGTFNLDPEGGGVHLSVLADGETERVQYILSGSAPGHDGWGSWVVAEGATAQPVDWFPQPGIIGSIRAFVPLTADPETCEDDTIKGQLQWIQSDLRLNYKGLGVAVRDFVEDGGLPGVPLERYWLSRARIVVSGGDRATIAIRLVAREMGDGSVVEEGLEAAYREGHWSVRLGDGR